VWLSSEESYGQKKIMKIGLLIAGGFTLLPIWRDPLWEGGKNAWQALYSLATSEQKKHITVEEALRRAREAYKESKQVARLVGNKPRAGLHRTYF